MTSDKFNGEVEILPRSSAPIDPTDFKQLYDLNRDCTWLESEYEALIELWNSCDSNQQKMLISGLLRRFELVDSQKLVEYGKKIADKIAIEWKLAPNKTRIVAVSDDSEADGSQAFLNSLKNKFAQFNGWSEKCFINNIIEARKAVKDGWTLVLLDDFFGTGNTIHTKLSWFRKSLDDSNLKNVTLKTVAIAGMEAAKTKLDTTGVDYYCPTWLKRGISDFYKGSQLAASKSDMLALEAKLSKRYSGLYLSTFQFGFAKSESLFCFHAYNVPNNVFPVFWWPMFNDNNKRKTILARLR